MKLPRPRILVAAVLLLLGACATEPADVRTQPTVTYQVRPKYPPELASTKVTGEVLVEFIVDAEGKPTRIAAKRSSRKEFEAPAVAAVAAWRFKPGTVNGKPVPTLMAVPIVFTLDPK